MKRYATTILIMSLALGSICYSDENSTERPAGTDPVAVEVGGFKALAAAEVLVIKDVEPWYDDGNVEALISLGKTYEVINTGDIATTTLSDYRIVIVASDQTTAAYNTLIANAGDLADYVSGGGVLLAHACDMGWNGGQWTSSWLPGGVGHLSGPTYTSNSLSIVDAASPIVDGISDAALDNWGYSAHGYFTGLVAGTNIVIGITGDPTGQPTYIEYTYGSGLVLATMQTIEWPWAGSTGTTQLLINEIEYAQAYEIEVVIDIKPGSCPNPFNPKSKGSVPVAIVGTDTLDVELINPASICLLIGDSDPVCAFEEYEIKDSTEPGDYAPLECYECFDADDEANWVRGQCDIDGDEDIDDDDYGYCGDDIMDLVVKFDTQELAAAIGEEARDECIEVFLVGETYAGRLITGADSIVMKTQKEKD